MVSIKRENVITYDMKLTIEQFNKDDFRLYSICVESEELKIRYDRARLTQLNRYYSDETIEVDTESLIEYLKNVIWDSEIKISDYIYIVDVKERSPNYCYYYVLLDDTTYDKLSRYILKEKLKNG